MPIACWLLPPEPHRDILEATILALAQKHDLPPFQPHVTLLGSTGALSAAEAIAKLQTLKGTGAVPIRLSSFAAEPPWHQTFVAVAEETPELCRAHQLAREAFHGTPEAEVSVCQPRCLSAAQSHCMSVSVCLCLSD